ncbi:MAG TPA: CHAT domain-containing protein [Vicinamibacteria bacterium]|nr:CHAT domain-containing protein [Vicinamibacteria bacterium]
MGPSRPARRRSREVLELFVLAPEPGAKAASILASFRNARVLERFPCRGGEPGARWQRIIRVHERVLAVLEARSGTRSLPGPGELRDFGRDLFEALLPGDVRRLYDTARSLQPDGVLDLSLTSMIDWVADKPWELAFDPARREFLGTSCVNVVRNVFTAVPADAPGRRRGRLRVLVASARPVGASPLSVAEETAALRAAFRLLVRAGVASVEVLPRATAGGLQRRLAGEAVDVLHFIGHGAFDRDRGEGTVLLEDERGRPRRLGVEAFRQIVCRRGLRLVFLNACESGRGGRVEWNRGVAPALVAAGVPAVLANQYPVLDAAATAFAREFYGALGRGRSLGDAARESRLAVGRELGTEGLEWAVPVLFARQPGGSLR